MLYLIKLFSAIHVQLIYIIETWQILPRGLQQDISILISSQSHENFVFFLSSNKCYFVKLSFSRHVHLIDVVKLKNLHLILSLLETWVNYYETKLRSFQEGLKII